MFSSTLKRSVVTLGVVAGLLAAAGPASAQGGGADFTRFASPGPHIGTSEVFELNTFGGNDTLRADSNEVAVESITLIREPAHTVTCLDQDLNSVRACARVLDSNAASEGHGLSPQAPASATIIVPDGEA